MSSIWLVLPVLVPLLTACACSFTSKHRQLTSFFSFFGAGLSLLAATLVLKTVVTQGVIVTAFGGWQAPFGIVFVADTLAAGLIVVSAIVGVAITFYSCADLKDQPTYHLYHALIHTLLAAVAGSFLTGDIFNLYVWFEVMLITAFGLMMLNANKAQVSAAIKYAVLNLISTMVLLLAIGLIYGATGTLNLADLHEKIAQASPATQMIIAGLFLFGFGVKASCFPLYSWLPASYPYLPNTVVALFSALLTKVGVYAILRLFTLVFPIESSGYQTTLLAIAGLTMLTGVLGAASQFYTKHILSFHIISQIGYMLMGLAIFTPLAIAGAIFYIIHHIIVKANLFLIAGYLEKRFSSDNLANMGNVYRSSPLLAFAFLIPAFSLAGFPPLSGFWGKLLVIKASLLAEHYLLAATALFVGLLTLFSMAKIWTEAFWKPLPDSANTQTISSFDNCLYLTPILMLSSLTVLIGLYAEPFYQFSAQASAQLLDPSSYTQAVLNEAVQEVNP